MRVIVIPNEPNPNMTGRHYALSKAFVAAGHEVLSITWDMPQAASKMGLLRYIAGSLATKQYAYEDFQVQKVRRLPYFWPHINGWFFKAQLKRIYTEFNADVIFSENYTNETVVPKGLPFIYDLADDYAAPADVYGSLVYRLAFKVLGVRSTMKKQCRNAVAVTAVSDILCDFARRYSKHVIKLPNGVERNIIEQVRNDASISMTNEHSIFYVSGFGPWSRPIAAMQAVVDLRKEFPGIELTLVGEGSEAVKMKQFIEDHGAAGYIHYLGHVHDRKAVFSLIQQHAIGLNISDKNTWRDAAHPMKVMDYSALGKKVVSADLAGVRALNLPNIYLFSDTNKKRALKTMLRRALKDTKTYAAVSDAVLKDYDWSALVKRLDFFDRYKVAMRVVHVTPSYPPNLGGLEKVVQSLARAQAAVHSNPTVITSDQGSSRDTELETFPVRRLKSFVVANTTIIPTLFTALLKLRKDDFVHLHITQAYTPEMVWLAAKLRGFRYIAHIHLDVPPSGPAGFLLGGYKSHILKRVLKRASSVVVFTEDQKRNLAAKYGIATDRIAVIPNGVADVFFYDKPRALSKKPRLLFVGRLNYQKNLGQLLEALAGISDKFMTTIVGEGELAVKLKKMAKDLKLKNVTFMGRADGESLLAQYRKADMFVLPSEREGMPLVLLEAMAMGLPVIATDVTGSRDVIKHGQNGLLVPYGDVEALRAALEHLVSDKPLYKKLSKTARDMARTFSWNKIMERFTDLYTQRSMAVRTSTKKGTPSIRVAVWKICLPLLVAANVAYMFHNIWGWTITLGFFLLVPGYLLLSLLKHGIQSRWEIASFSLGLSILLLMVGGLALNSLHGFGFERPLSTLPIFILLDIVTLGLLLGTGGKEITLSQLPMRPSIKMVGFIAALTVLPLLAVGGAIRINNGASNILTMVLFALIPTFFILLIRCKSLTALYPYAIFTIGLSILFSNSLRGWSITGHDIHHEFGVFQTVLSSGLWRTMNSSGDPYNACLSITILPTLFSRITSISAAYVYKVLFQIIFAFGLLPIFYLLKRFTTDTKALIGGFIFITFPVFLNDMPFLNRQEIAFLFFALLMLVNFSHMARRSKTILTLLFLLSLILSHYSSSYVTAGLLLFAWCFYKVWARKSRIFSRTDSLPMLSLPIILIALLLTFAWNAQITASTSNLKNAITETIGGIVHRSSIRNGSSQYSLFSTGHHQTLQQEFMVYASKGDAQTQYVAPTQLPVTSLGRYVSRFADVRMLNNSIHTLIAKILQVVLLLGIGILVIRQWKKASQWEAYLRALSVAFTLLLALLTILPQLSVDYDVTRLFQQSLILLALPMIMALEFLFSWCGSLRQYAVAVFVSLLFLHLSGFIPQLTGGYLPQLTLNNAGFYYDYFYTHASDVVSSTWLARYGSPGRNVFTDTVSSALPLKYRTSVGLVSSKSTAGGYLYEGYTNVHGVYRTFLSGGVAEYTNPNAQAEGNVLYTNQDSRIYAK